MGEACPVCGDTVEHVRVEEPGEGTQSGSAGGAASFDLDQLCSVAEDDRWDRICTAATPAEGRHEGPGLDVYYHFFGSDD